MVKYATRLFFVSNDIEHQPSDKTENRFSKLFKILGCLNFYFKTIPPAEYTQL